MAAPAVTATGVSFAKASFQKTDFVDTESYGDILKSWPAHIDSQMAWEGATFKSEAEYTYVLSPEEKLEINEALAYFKCQYQTVINITQICLLTYISPGTRWKRRQHYKLPSSKPGSEIVPAHTTTTRFDRIFCHPGPQSC